MLENKRKVAILMATYNGISYVEDQIKTILKQEEVDLKIYVSDDMSDDGTYEYLKNLAKSNNKIILLPRIKRHGRAALNFFYLLTNVDYKFYDYVCFADQDDLWDSCKTIRAINVIESSKAVAYSCNVEAFWNNGCKKIINKAQKQKEWDFFFEAAGPGCTYLFKSDIAIRFKEFLFKKRNMLSSYALHDWLFYAFVRANNERWIIDEYVGLKYRQHSNNEIGVNYGLGAYRKRLLKVIDGWWIEQSLILANTFSVNKNLTWFYLLKKNKRLGYIYLALNAKKCRRKKSEQLISFFLFLFLALRGD